MIKKNYFEDNIVITFFSVVHSNRKLDTRFLRQKPVMVYLTHPHSLKCIISRCIHQNPTYSVGKKVFAFFFQKFSFYFSTSRIQLAFSNVCSITIYDLLTTLWKRKDSAFVKVLRLLAEEVDEVHFEVILVVDFFSRPNGQKKNETNGSPWEPSLENKVDVAYFPWSFAATRSSC